MNYYVARNGKEYGPYSEKTVRDYVAAGSLLTSDNIREESGQSWRTVGQLLQPAAPAAPLPYHPPQPAVPLPYHPPQPAVPLPYYSQQPAPALATPQILPPDLHWAIVLLLSITWIFPFIWALVQASWARKINPTSKAGVAYALCLLFSVLNLLFYGALIAAAVEGDRTAVGGSFLIQALCALLGGICYLTGSFSIRRSMLTYYNSREPIQLRLSGVMTFFFGILYLQYHMSRIARWKKTGYLFA